MSGPALSQAGRELFGPALILAAGLAGYLLFPDNLAFLTRIVCVALLVLSLDLITGYCGIPSLGQAAFYGAGAYAAGIACLNGVTDPLALIVIGAAGGAAAGLLAGALMLRAHGLTQLVLSIAVVQLLHEAANKASRFTGGSDGLSGMMPAPLLGLFEFDLWGRAAYLFGLGLLALVFLALRLIVRSPFGMSCRAIGEDPLRASALGIRAFPVLLRMFAISGAVAGTGGALAAIATQVVGLDSLSFELSATALVMLVLGGIGRLHGALIGTVVFMTLEHGVATADPFHWMMLVGAVLVALVTFAPRGLSGPLDTAARLLRGAAAGGGR